MDDPNLEPFRSAVMQELRAINYSLRTMRGWVTLMGVVTVLGIIATVVRALL